MFKHCNIVIFEYLKTTLFIALAITQVALVVIPIFGKLFTEVSGATSYKITLYGRLILITALIGLLVTLGLYLYSENETEKNQKNLSDQLSLRDSLNQVHSDSLQKRAYLNTIELLAKYGYKTDSTTNRLIKIIKDSSKTKVIIGPDPIVVISNYDNEKGISIQKKGNGMATYQYTIVSSDAGSCCFELSASFLGLLPNNSVKYFGKATPLNISSQLQKDGFVSAFFPVSEIVDITFLFIWLRGNYKNIDKSKSFSMDQVYYYNIKGNTFGYFTGETRKNVINDILKNEK